LIFIAAELAVFTSIIKRSAASFFCFALSAAARKDKRNVASWDGPAGGPQLTMCKTPAETYDSLVAKGEGAAKMSVLKTLYVSFMGGCYVGMAGLLSCAISGGMPGASEGAQHFIFAALFPVNLLLVLQSGAQLFTGNTATLPAAFYEGKATVKQWAKSWICSYFGNICGGGLMAIVAWYCGLFSHGTDSMVVAYAVKKCSFNFLQTMIKAIMCNWLVCMAVYLSLQANDLTGKMVGIWFPISTFVAIGFEHSVANMFILPGGLLAGAPLTLPKVILRNLIPVTIGNAIAGSIVFAGGLSFSFGKLGSGNRGSFTGWFKTLTGSK